jgi:hypothetical protein
VTAPAIALLIAMLRLALGRLPVTLTSLVLDLLAA